MKRAFSISIFAVALWILPGGASSYVLTGDHWPGATTAFYVSIFNIFDGSISPSGVPWDDAFVQAADSWNSQTPFTFSTVPMPSDPCDISDLRNGVDFTLNVCGNSFGSGVVAVSLSSRNGPIRVESDIVFNGNSEVYWDVFNGSDPFYIDLRRVAAHELGHALCLAHEDRVTALMNPVIAGTEVPISDDIAGVNALYAGGLPGTVATFRGLDFLFPSGAMGATDISADGTTVVGSNNARAVRWDASAGFGTSLPNFPCCGPEAQALGVSGDGSVITGYARGAVGQQPVRWVNESIESLGEIDGQQVTGNANAISADGHVIVGGVNTAAGHEVVRWVDGQIERLVGLVFGRALAVSADGAVIGGYAPTSPVRPFRWENGTFVLLEGLLGPAKHAVVWEMTPDGTILMGNSKSESGQEAVRWVNGIIESLGDLPGGFVSASVYASNADGSLIGGRGWDGTTGKTAVIWDRMNGMRELKAVLEQDFGLDLGNWELDAVLGISDDGSVLTGFGHNPNGEQQPWVVVVPEPSASLMIPIGVGLLVVLARLRRAAPIL